MEDGYIDDFDMERIISAVEEDMDLRPIEKPKVVVQNHESKTGDSHVVNLEESTCTCDDYQFNCKKEANRTGRDRSCKHILFVAFKRAEII